MSNETATEDKAKEISLYDAVKQLYPYCHEEGMIGETGYERAWLNVEKAMLQLEVEAKKRASEYGDLDKDLVIYALEEASEQWKAEYDNCRATLQELVDLKIMKDEKGDSMEYRVRKPLAWIAAKNFLKKYQHQ